MIDVTGAFLLVLIFSSHMSSKGGLAIHEMDSYESCKAVLMQLKQARELYGYCIAKEIIEDE